tara:strand:- start:452 stop:2227 length:1776 start_codon:yes stop_codon:yes gene_type:complete
MCGVLVIFSKKGHKLQKTRCLQAADKLYNRGPDSFKSNFFRNGSLFISNTVLSITGKSIGKNLIKSKNNNFEISFNGQIYNYLDLKNRFIEKNNFDNEESDTKLLVNLYEKINYKKIPEYLNGMFAYVVYDKQKDRLIIVNDTQGEKNFYYFENSDFFIVSSTINCIVSFLGEISLNLVTLSNYFKTRHYMPVQNQTSYENIKLFNNSSNNIYNFKNKKLIINNYDDPFNWISENEHRRLQKLPELEVFNYFENALHEQIKLMIPQKNFGCIVSGGIDSTLQSTLVNLYSSSSINLAVDHINKDPIMKNINRFNPFFKTKIKKIKMNKKKYQNLINKCYEIVQSPMQTHDLPSRLLLSNYFKKNNCKVFFSADGCDELLGGQQIYEKIFFKKINYDINNSPYSKIIDYGFYDEKEKNKSLEKYFNKNWIKINNNYQFIFDKKSKSIQSSLFLDYFIQSINVANRSNDLICCENSVEPRNIFIQKNILKIILNLPLKYKINFAHSKKELRQKYILKMIFLKYLNKNLIFKKSGFSGFPNTVKINKYKSLKILKKKINICYKNKKKYQRFKREINWKIINSAKFLQMVEKKSN